MDEKMTYEEASRTILNLLTELLNSLGCSEAAIFSVFCCLPEPIQQYRMLEWVEEKMMHHYLKEYEILEHARLMSQGCSENI